MEVAAATSAEFAGVSEAAYGYRVLLRHYCVHLAGPDPAASLRAFPGDAQAARGFNGDLGQHLGQWRTQLAESVAADLLGVRAARKSLLAIAGLVSVADGTWTTSRAHAAQCWSELEPGLAMELSRLHSWASRASRSTRYDVGRVLAEDGIVAAIAERFNGLIGLWPDPPEGT